MRAIVLGTSPPGASIRPDSAGTGILVSIDDTNLLLDVGPGITPRIEKAGVDLREVRSVFLTHHHWDHYSDLGHLVLGRWEKSLYGSGRGSPLAPALEVFGAPPTRHIVELLFGKDGVYAGDIKSRTSQDMGVKMYQAVGAKVPYDPPMPVAKDIGPGLILERHGYTVTAAEAQHAQPYINSLAYRIDYNGKSVVYSGDTAPCDRVTRLAEGADLLFHEGAGSEERRMKGVAANIHSSSTTVGKTAADAGVKKLVIVHHGFGARSSAPLTVAEMAAMPGLRGRSIDEFIAEVEQEIHRNFKGPVSVAKDMEVFDV